MTPSSPALSDHPSPGGGRDRYLYRWQLDALTAWLDCGRRGVIEAVTGSGKTDLALEAVADARRRGLFVMVVVPSRVLVEQWHGRLRERFPDMRVGRLGDARHDLPADCDILVATRHSAASRKPAPPTDAGGLLIADECHGFGGGVLRRSLRPGFQERLGLTATLERTDDAVEKILLPYFGGVCYRYGFREAIDDGVCAQPRVAFMAVPLTEEEREDYAETERQLVDARRTLRAIPDMPTSFGDFLGVVNYLAEKDAGPNGRAAKEYLRAFSKRREIVASSTSKYEALGRLERAIRQADGALIFTETVRAANHAVNRLDPYLDIEVITGETGRTSRSAILDDLRGRKLDAVAAPRVLDEGVDVPNANLGIVVSASRTRRQMIQRMGRILRRKQAGNGARFVIIFASGTMEDPAASHDRDGFLDEIEDISDSTRVFRRSEFDRLPDYLDYAGPAIQPEPVRIGRGGRLAGAAATAPGSVDEPYPVATTVDEAGNFAGPALGGLHRLVTGEPDRRAAEAMVVEMGPSWLYARLHFLDWGEPSWLHRWADEALSIPEPPPARPDGSGRDPVDQQGEPSDESPYLGFDEIPMPALSKAKAKPKRLSTGEHPVVMVSLADGWAMRCTGCGATSPTTRFKFEVFDQTVECVCGPE